MTKLTWDNPSDRKYSYGLDRGVLFTSLNNGVAWSGLVRAEVDDGGSSFVSYYVDGIKTSSDKTSSYRGATIEAFTYPEEFENFMGDAVSSNGLTLHDQPARGYFHLSWRTFTGDQTDEQKDYTIHILYNCLAIQSAVPHSTVNSQINLQTFNWRVSTVPMFFDGFTPTAYVSFNSKDLTPSQLKDLELVLYGRPTAPPKLLLPKGFDDLLAGINYHEITFDSTTGLSNIEFFTGNDISGNVNEGLFKIPQGSDLTPTETGLFKIGTT